MSEMSRGYDCPWAQIWMQKHCLQALCNCRLNWPGLLVYTVSMSHHKSQKFGQHAVTEAQLKTALFDKTSLYFALCSSSICTSLSGFTGEVKAELMEQHLTQAAAHVRKASQEPCICDFSSPATHLQQLPVLHSHLSYDGIYMLLL